MTTLTVEIDKKEDLSTLTEYIDRLGLRYGIEKDHEPINKPATLNAVTKVADIDAFRKLLLAGPVMDDKQYEEYKEMRKRINKWRTK